MRKQRRLTVPADLSAANKQIFADDGLLMKLKASSSQLNRLSKTFKDNRHLQCIRMVELAGYVFRPGKVSVYRDAKSTFSLAHANGRCRQRITTCYDRMCRGQFCRHCGLQRSAEIKFVTNVNRHLTKLNRSLLEVVGYTKTPSGLQVVVVCRRPGCRGNKKPMLKSTSNLQRRPGCKYCSHAVAYSNKEVHEFLSQRTPAIILRTPVYRGRSQYLSLECGECSYRWRATFANLKIRRSGCPECGGNAKLTAMRVRKLARDRGGSVLSAPPFRADKRIHWRCKTGHDWWQKWGPISSGTWCPDCGGRSSYGERLTRQIFQLIFNTDFQPIWGGRRGLPWLMSRRTRCAYQLDGFSSRLNLAFEYQGWRHQSAIQKKRDKEKARLCKENSVRLVYVEDHFSMAKNPVDAVAEIVRNIPGELLGTLSQDQWIKRLVKNIDWKDVFSSNAVPRHRSVEFLKETRR